MVVSFTVEFITVVVVVIIVVLLRVITADFKMVVITIKRSKRV